VEGVGRGGEGRNGVRKMRYMGSKRLLAKHILPIMLKDRLFSQTYVEPFVGGANILDKVIGSRLACDASIETILALQYIQNIENQSDFPTNRNNFSEGDYKQAKIEAKTNKTPRNSYIGYALSYAGQYYAGFVKDKINKRDYVNEAYRNALKQSKLIQDVSLVCCDYSELTIPDNSIVYCDIPYKSTTKYKTQDFDYDKFYSWCLENSRKYKIYISEYSMPKEFLLLWSKEVNSSLTANTGGKKAVEKLFTPY